MGTIIVGIIVLAIVAAVVVKMVKDKKSGKSLQCGCNCKDCKGCH